MSRGLYVETRIRGPLDRVWELTQEPALHERWDLRFSTISYLPRPDPNQPQRFIYTTRIGLGLTISGTGESVATRETASSVRTSSLRFWSEHPLSLIEEGSGFWKYVPPANGDALRFYTWYDYRVRFGVAGRVADLLFRPLIGWATAWSFDRLRLWVEDGLTPETVRSFTLTYTCARLTIIVVWLWHGLVPKLLFHNADELTMLRAAGLSTSRLPWVGGAEVAFALLGLLLWRWRLYLLLTSAAMVLALGSVWLTAPRFIAAAFNPVTLNLAVGALGLIGWWSAPYAAFASRCRRRPPTESKQAEH